MIKGMTKGRTGTGKLREWKSNSEQGTKETHDTEIKRFESQISYRGKASNKKKGWKSIIDQKKNCSDIEISIKGSSQNLIQTQAQDIHIKLQPHEKVSKKNDDRCEA